LDNWKSNIAIALIAGTSATAGSLVTGYYLLQSSAQQIEAQQNQYRTDQKVKHIQNLIKLSSEYGRALDNLINTGLSDSNNEKKLNTNISAVQLKGMELILVTNDDIAQVVNSVNYYAALYLKNRNTSESEESLNKLGTINVMLMKSLRSLIHANYEFELNSPTRHHIGQAAECGARL
jgi:hypothetical protein